MTELVISWLHIALLRHSLFPSQLDRKLNLSDVSDMKKSPWTLCPPMYNFCPSRLYTSPENVHRNQPVGCEEKFTLLISFHVLITEKGDDYR